MHFNNTSQVLVFLILVVRSNQVDQTKLTINSSHFHDIAGAFLEGIQKVFQIRFTKFISLPPKIFVVAMAIIMAAKYLLERAHTATASKKGEM